jgi:Animal haem peroxidase
MRRILAAAAASVLLLAGATTATASGGFTPMFDDLARLRVPDRQLAQELAPSMLERDGRNSPNALGAGYTFFGQFIDHDLTLDTRRLPQRAVNIHRLRNRRTPLLDLDSVYGRGPFRSPQLYVGARFRLPPGIDDVNRRPDGTAVIPDGRKDENTIVSQLHLAFLRLHNQFVDGGTTFTAARRATIARYQSAILTDWLPAMVGDTAVARALVSGARRYDPTAGRRADLPVEFSGAARFGHSMVRTAYRLAEAPDNGPNPPFVPVFDGSPKDMTGGRPVPADHVVYWPNFFQFPAEDPAAAERGELDDPPVNVHRRIDTFLADDLFQLPAVPFAIAGGPVTLAERNLIRGKHYGLPDGQAVARRLGFRPLTNRPIGLGLEWRGRAPLWFYVLAEADVQQDGKRLGRVGGTIVADTIVGLLRRDPNSILAGAHASRCDR